MVANIMAAVIMAAANIMVAAITVAANIMAMFTTVAANIMGMGTMVVGITVIGTRAMAAIGTSLVRLWRWRMLALHARGMDLGLLLRVIAAIAITAMDDRLALRDGTERTSFGVVQHLKTVLQPLQVTVYKQIGAHEVTVPR